MRIGSLISTLALASLLCVPRVCRAQIPASYFGMHNLNHPRDFPMKVERRFELDVGSGRHHQFPPLHRQRTARSRFTKWLGQRLDRHYRRHPVPRGQLEALVEW